MTRPFPNEVPRWPNRVLAVLVPLTLAACAGVPPQAVQDGITPWTTRIATNAPALAIEEVSQAQLRRERARLLSSVLDERAALTLALQGSTRTQALLAEGWAAQAAAAERGAAPSVHIALERIIHGDERSYGQSLGLGLVDWLTWPARQGLAQQQQAVQRLKLSQDLLGLHVAVRQQWLRSVAAVQLVTYHEQVREAAEASAELARRMQQVGNFSRLQRAREQAFLSEATAQLARAMLQATQEREALVRLLGLNTEEAQQLRLPARLPDVPRTVRSTAETTRAAQAERLDLALAHAQWQAAARTQSLAWTAAADIGLTLGREREGSSRSRSAEIEWHLPLLDSWRLRQQSRSAEALAASHRLELAAAEAGSQLRERYASYRTSHELAVHARDELVPLRKTITDEMLLKYNGMLVGVFELLADARSQVGAVITAIEAQRDFWIADAALDAAILGVPAAAADLSAAKSEPGRANPGH